MHKTPGIFKHKDPFLDCFDGNIKMIRKLMEIDLAYQDAYKCRAKGTQVYAQIRLDSKQVHYT